MTRKHRRNSKTIFFASAAVLALSLLSSSFAQATNSRVSIDRIMKAQGYTSDYSSKEEARNAGLAINQQIAEEGMVLLKNESNTLPLLTRKGSEATRVTLFGYASYAPVGGASESGDTSAGTVRLTSDIYSSLRDAGYVTNPVVRDYYANAEGTTDYATADGLIANTTVTGSYRAYGDAAVVVLSSGSVADETIEHRLTFDTKQYALIEHVKANFDKVILLINNSVPVEIDSFKKDTGIDAILVVGQPGDNGFDAVGRILNGEVNPSGHLPDTYAVDTTSAPSYHNYSQAFAQRGVVDLTGASGDYLKYFIDENDNNTIDEGEEVNTYLTVYEEGIYVGYRYYETVAAVDGNDDWYNATVSYPFGYGLSYTTFNKVVTPVTTSASTITKDSVLQFDVTVTNTGDVAGKEVVQLYFSAPYTAGGIEKSSIILGDFTKTDVLEPGESQTLRVKVDARDMASYDYKTNETYVLEDGDYVLTVRDNVHATPVASFTYSVAADELVSTSASGTTVTNRFDDVSDWMDANDENLSRQDFAGKSAEERMNLTSSPTIAERKLTATEYEDWNGDIDSAADDEGQPWYTADMPTYADEATRPAEAAVKLADLIGKDYDDPLWEDLLDELSLSEMEDLINYGGFHTVSVDYIGKPYSHDTDGPKGWTGTGTAGSRLNAYAAEPVIAATFNKELAYEMGKNVADQGLWGSSDRTDIAAGGRVYGYTGWYAPAMNTHRSPFDGRYTEYYSEDGYLAGMMAANASLGAKSKGAYVFIKHFALHDDGGGVAGSYDHATGTFNITGYRGSSEKESGMSVWCNEQAMREVYFKPFQMAVEIGGATAAMSAFNRIGKVWAGGSYALLTEILRDEWGFRGFVATDISIYGFLNADQMIRAGGDTILNSGGSIPMYTSDYTKSNPATQVAAMRNAAHNILYTVANSNAMQIPLGAAVYYDEAYDYVDTATVGTAYSSDIASAVLNTMHNYVDPSTITYAHTGGALPAGITLSADGQLTGTPTAEGTYVFEVTASVEGYASGTRTFQLRVVKEAEEVVIPDYSDEIGALEDAIDDLNDKVDSITTPTTPETSDGNGLAVAGLIVGIIGVVVGAGAVVLVLLKRK